MPLRYNDYKNNEDVDLIEKQHIVESRLMELERMISGQRIDEVKSNYELRSQMAKNRMNFLKYEYCTVIDAL